MTAIGLSKAENVPHSALKEQDVYQVSRSESLLYNDRGVVHSDTRWFLAFPYDNIADSDRPTVEHFGKCAAAPSVAHGLLQSRGRFFHQLARSRFAADPQAARSYAQHAPACVLQVHA